MNRFVLIGNGFDKAHDLPTGYDDFLFNFFIEHLKIACKSDSLQSNDQLVQVKFLKKVKILEKDLHETFDSFEDLLRSEYVDWGSNNQEGLSKKHFHVKVNYQSSFFENLVKGINWTDIEKSYFNYLVRIFEKSKQSTINNLDKELAGLNSDFEFLKSKVIQYIKLVDDEEIQQLHPMKLKHLSLIEECVRDPDITYVKRYVIENEAFENEDDKVLDDIHFINFNYTSLLKKYFYNNPTNVRYYPIHGSVGVSESVIFGYGDDSISGYQSLEDADNPNLLKHIKSFYYPNKRHYLDVINALDIKEFDVLVVGHSLGLSDRVLLKTIFEHDNCRAIKLIHRGTKESQFRKRISLSRHFSDKAKMRSRIVDYDQRDRFN